jgi:hypothetical protein
MPIAVCIPNLTFLNSAADSASNYTNPIWTVRLRFIPGASASAHVFNVLTCLLPLIL